MFLVTGLWKHSEKFRNKRIPESQRFKELQLEEEGNPKDVYILTK